MIIKRKKSVIPACDVEAPLFERLIKETANIEGIGAYKLGFQLALSIGLPRAVEIARRHTDKPLIYDHQKAGTDIPDMGRAFAKVCKSAAINAVILFPQAGPETERAWISAAKEEGLGVIVGGLMTHKAYLASDGGYIADEMVVGMYSLAVDMGVGDFVVPGTSPVAIAKIRALIEGRGVQPVLYSPGFVAQGGSVTSAAKGAGERYHAIVGRAIYGAKDIRLAAERICEQMGG